MNALFIIRRIHMYFALFLSPWVLMYALSTMAMNHRHFFRAYYDHQPPAWELEREVPYNAAFSPDTKRWMVGEQILSDLNLEGSHRTRGRLDRQIVVTRHDPISPKRITYNPKAQTLKIENRIFRTPTFLEDMHRRRGYGKGYMADELWAFSVDLFIVSAIIWAISGIYMWWTLKNTRKWGAICLASGTLIFTFFLCII